MVRIFRSKGKYHILATDFISHPAKLDAIDKEVLDLESCKKTLLDYFSTVHGGNIGYVRVYFAWFVNC